MIPLRLWLYAALIAALIAGAWRLDVSRQAIGYDRAKAEYTAAALKAEQAARAKENEWQESANNKREKKDAEIQTLNARVNALSSELRKRPTRPISSNMPENPGTCQSATGSGLYREDAEFLVGFASDAARVAIERDYCYARYNGLLNSSQTP